MAANISSQFSLPEILRLLAQSNRLQIVFTIGSQEACVCHIEAVLGIRQATISQHLMALRDAGLVTAHRDGRNIFYRLANPDLLSAIRQVATVSGSSLDELELLAARPVAGCPCPHCAEAAGLLPGTYRENCS